MTETVSGILIDPYTNEPLTDPPADLMRLIERFIAESDFSDEPFDTAWLVSYQALAAHLEAVARVVLKQSEPA